MATGKVDFGKIAKETAARGKDKHGAYSGDVSGVSFMVYADALDEKKDIAAQLVPEIETAWNSRALHDPFITPDV